MLLFAVGALGVDYIVMGSAPSLAWLFVGRAFAGVAGASFTPAYAYVADVSPSEKRAQNFGMIGAAFGGGFILGPALGGILGGFGPRAPFFAAASLSLLNQHQQKEDKSAHVFNLLFHFHHVLLNAVHFGSRQAETRRR